ncbi:ATP-binding protein [Candidatus Solirubrobacter pratensis]|uniref:ATP-binding protein n=1 Tax=Candidatus Solirubrobacter pratensis TaxID=1298857 RepID=UPI0026F409F7|nr:LuxR family transcriptional regulator [Candidatus Solirubrobacter pratensis]
MRRAIPAAEFVGRSRELAVLHEALEAARAGAPPMLVVHGEAGIGKTRTIAEFARAAEDDGAAVLWGTCYQGCLTYPYGPWAQALGAYLDGVPGDRVASVLGVDAAALAQLLPPPARLAALPALPPGQGRLRLYEAVVRCLQAIERTPVLVLDDIQWADADSLDLLVHVARFATRPLIVLAHRGGDLDPADPVTQRLAEISRHRESDHVPLESLPRDEAGVLLEHVAQRRVGNDTLTAIYDESGGNPFFLGELGRHLQRRGQDPGAPGWRPPATVRQAVGLRLAGLSKATREMLQLAAVFTSGFGFVELSALTGLDEAALLDCLDEALAAEVLEPAGPERYDFAHALVRHTLYDRFSPSRRARIHRRLAEALERTHGAQLGAEIARQYRASATFPGAEAGVPYAIAAAAAASAVPAPAEAEELLEIALALDTGAQRAGILGRLALARAEAGRHAEAVATLTAALDLMSKGEEIATLIQRVLTVLQDGLADQASLDPLIARGLAALGDRHGLAWARLKLLERPTEAILAGDVHATRFLGFDPEAVRIARVEGTEADAARTIDQFAQWPLPELESFMTRVAGWHDPLARLRGLLLLGMSATVTRWSGASLPAEQLCAEIELLGERTGSLPARAMAAVFRAAIHGARGEFGESVAALDRAASLMERLPSGHAVTNIALLVRELTLQHVEADWPAMGERMYALARRRDPGPWFGLMWAAIAAHAFARAGLEDRSRFVLGRITPAISACDPWDNAQSGAVNFAAEAIWDLRATDLAAPLLTCAQALVDAGAGDYYMASSELTVARLQALLGHGGGESFDRARCATERRDQRPLRAIVDHDDAIARQWTRQAGAEPLLRSAAARFEELGMNEWAGRAPPRSGLPDGLTAREVEVLRLLAAGRTNKEIASELVLSVHTVERHLANAYRKISVRNRADATAYVLRSGL